MENIKLLNIIKLLVLLDETKVASDYSSEIIHKNNELIVTIKIPLTHSEYQEVVAE